ncbi:DUF3592 domain-containing protein [Corallococcus sp. AB011P]|uniref:DUF3592 domain-containing protein n=1 Tax=Corallococcus sp. AB011P TaxID=2316735 RepID=UPI000EA004FD|nr:DUF3592 domain-containing protein [Corallococcus sp. AB011P]RKG62473.1 DUF3592 domain-containing protein [Corallococcus sp. AB011P]
MSPFFLLLIAVAFGSIPLRLMAMSLNAYWLSQKLRAEGHPAQGTLIRVRRALRARYPEHIVEYVFPLPGGEEIHDSYRVRSTPWDRPPAEGDSIQVRYLPHDPQQHQRVGDEVGPSQLILRGVLLGTVLVVMALAVLDLGQELGP